MYMQHMPQHTPSTSPLGSVPLTGTGTGMAATNVSKSYGAGEFTKQVVQNCSFTIESGKLTVMIGPSGCGKSTLIRLLAGFERPSSGTITIGGKPVTGRGLDAMTKHLMQEYYANLYEEFRRTTFFVTTDVDEAIYLADRILIMTNIPTQVRAVIDVN